MWARTRTVAMVGMVGHVIDVQVDLSNGKIRTALVGRPDASVSEAVDRCRAAVDNSALHWPTDKRITILLSPADLPKRGTHLDLAIAAGVAIAADKEFEKEAAGSAVLIGELNLDGRLRPVSGVLPMVLAARASGIGRVIVPEPQAAEAALVDGLEVFGVRSLGQALAVLSGHDAPEAPPVDPPSSAPLISWAGSEGSESLDLADVHGMTDARFALEVAAAGGHHLMLSGPKGSGKTTLVERIPSILPDLTPDEALELTVVNSLAGSLPSGAPVITRPPFRAPHHSASRTGVLGGGTGRVRPGEVSRAHLGVLFLDEFPLFPADVIDALREPLESGIIRLSRGDEDAVYPARAMVVFGCNPCPCGEYSRRDHGLSCDCGELRRREYRRKIRGPIVDRIDITRHVEPISGHELADPFAVPEPSRDVRARVARARARQAVRFAGEAWRLNGHVPGPELKTRWPLAGEAMRILHTQVLAGQLTQRGAVRVHRLAWTVADLRGRVQPAGEELNVALRLRSGDPLDVQMLPRQAG